MRRLSVIVVVMALVGLLGFSDRAEAQALDLTDYMGWWDSLNCQYMIGAINALMDTTNGASVEFDVDGSAGADPAPVYTSTGGIGDTPGERLWCHMWDGLREVQQTAVKNAVTMGAGMITRKTTAEIISQAGWWSALDNVQRRVAIGEVGLADDTNSLSGLTGMQRDRADAAFAGLQGEGGGMTPMPTPAVPLVGLGILGLLLAGRGAYLRRRQA